VNKRALKDDALTISAQGADLGLANMEGVTDALGAAIVTGIKGTESYSQAMGLLDATTGQGNMRMEDLVAALSTGVLPAAKNFGLSLQDVGAALATLTDNGMRADEAATRLRMTFSLVAAPSNKAEEALSMINMASTQLAND
jgi:TP901 family phage tail tape measure protein